MYKIYKITSNHVVDFAATELKKYLRIRLRVGCREAQTLVSMSLRWSVGMTTVLQQRHMAL